MTEVPLLSELTQEDVNSLYNTMIKNANAYKKMKALNNTLIKGFELVAKKYLDDIAMLKINGIKNYESTEYKKISDLLCKVNPKLKSSEFEKRLNTEFPVEVINETMNEEDNYWEYLIFKRPNYYQVLYCKHYNRDNAINNLNLKSQDIIFTISIAPSTHDDIMKELERKQIIERVSSIKFKTEDEQEFIKAYNTELEKINDFN